MLLNGLGFVSRTLHVYPEYFKDIPTERLLGEGILPQHINDDVLGRFLDCLYAEGVGDYKICYFFINYRGWFSLKIGFHFQASAKYFP